MSSLAINLQDVDTTRLFKNKEGCDASVRFFCTSSLSAVTRDYLSADPTASRRTMNFVFSVVFAYLF